jgi:phosphopantothenoylcysteine synthetase/decarboxylase
MRKTAKRGNRNRIIISAQAQNIVTKAGFQVNSQVEGVV